MKIIIKRFLFNIIVMKILFNLETIKHSLSKKIKSLWIIFLLASNVNDALVYFY